MTRRFTPRNSSVLLALRGSDCPVVNVSESGCSVADYIALSEYYRERFHPRWVVIQMGAADLLEAWDPGRDARFEAAGGTGQVKLRWTPPAPPEEWTWARRWGYTLANSSSLIRYGRLRVATMMEWWADQPPLFNATSMDRSRKQQREEREIPVEAELDLLFEAYEGRITLLYTTPRFVPGRASAPSDIDRRVREYARARGVSFVDMAALSSDMARRGVALHGFPNTRPFTGHWNEAGHRVAAQALDREFRRLATSHGVF